MTSPYVCIPKSLPSKADCSGAAGGALSSAEAILLFAVKKLKSLGFILLILFRGIHF